MNNKSLSFLAIVSLLIFISMTFSFTDSGNFQLDTLMISFIDQWSSPVMIDLMKGLSWLGSSEIILFLTLVITLIFLFKRDWYHTLFFLIVSVGGVALNFILKFLFQRERPDGEISYIEVFNFSFEIPSYSFPSGHTMRSAILLLFLLYLAIQYLKKTWIKTITILLNLILILGVALSRLFLEAHYFSDTLAALSISVAWFTVIYLIMKRYKKEETNIFSRQFL